MQTVIMIVAGLIAAALVTYYVTHQLANRSAPEQKGRQAAKSPVVRRVGSQFPKLREVVVIDFETTGLDPSKDRIVSAAAISANIESLIWSRGEQVQYWKARVNPEQPIPPETTRIHGITDDDVRDEKPFRDHAESLLEFIGSRTIIAHNAKFDVSFLRAELNRCGMEMPDVEVLCTMKHGAHMLGMDRVSLDRLARELGVKGRKSKQHDALEDAILTLKIATAMSARKAGLNVNKMDVG